MIKTIEIERFGALNQRVYHLTPGMNIFYGLNEAGKSTLIEFIRQMLFGFPKQAKSRRDYREKKTKYMGGRLLIEAKEGFCFWVARSMSDKVQTFQVTSMTGEVLPEKVLSDYLNHLNEQDMKQLFQFNQDELHQLTEIEKDKLNALFYTLSGSGSLALFELSERLEEEASDLYTLRSSKKPIDQTLEQLRLKKEQVDELKQQQDEYFVLEKEESQLQPLKQEAQQRVEQLRQEQQLSQQLKERQALYEEYLQYHEIANQLASPFSKEEVEQMITYTTRYHALEDQINQMNQELMQIELHQDIFERESQLTHSLVQLNEWLNETKEQLKIRQQNELKRHQLNDLHQRITSLVQNYHLGQVKDVNRLHHLRQPLSPDERSYLKQLVHQQNEIEQRRQTLTILMNKLRNEQQQIQNELDNEQTNLTNRSQSINLYEGLFIGATGIGGILAIIVGWTMQSNARMLSIILGGCLLVGAWALTKRKTNQDEKKNHPLVFKKERLEQLNHEFKQLMTEQETINQRDETLNQQLNDWAIQSRFSGLIQDWDQFIKSNGFENLIIANVHKEELEQSLKVEEVKEEQWLKRMNQRLSTYQEGQLDTKESVQESIESLLKEQEQLSQLIDERQRQLKYFTDKQLQVKAQLEKMDEQKKMWLRQINQTHWEDLLAHVNREQARQLAIIERDRLTSLLKDYMERLEQVDWKALDERLIQVEKDLAKAIHELNHLTNQLAQVEAKLTHLSRLGSYETELLNLEQLKAQLYEQLISWGSRRIGSVWLQRVLSATIGSDLNQVFECAAQYFSRLTDGRYVSIRSGQKNIEVKTRDNEWLKLVNLSTGTLEQLYLSIRLAFIEQTAVHLRLPLVVDDAFINFDFDRRHRTYDILKQVSHSRQVIIFTFDHSIMDWKESHESVAITRL
ncbi:ATP-binding protein [Atopobacter phocae]|uniref:ATP-binding protein n=1 Tax=Atopobacter phocae TaxID=136492 RepID=UPI0004717736|nr:AAA family ATPase [Atopobacter phocae]